MESRQTVGFCRVKRRRTRLNQSNGCRLIRRSGKQHLTGRLYAAAQTTMLTAHYASESSTGSSVEQQGDNANTHLYVEIGWF